MHPIALFFIALAAAIGIGWTTSTITKRQHVARALAGEERWRLIVGSLHEGLIVHDRHQRIVEYNAAAARILGLPDRAINRHPSDLPNWQAIREDGSRWPPSTHPVALTLETGLPRVGDVMGVVREARPVVWLTLNTQPMFDTAGDVDGVVLTFTDTTSEREAQAALRSSEARFAALVERSSDIICVLDGSGAVQYASPAADWLLGPSGIAVGRSFLELVHPDDVAALQRAFEDLLQEPGAVGTAALRIRDLLGHWHHMEAVGCNRLDDPAIAGVVVNVRDVTERAEAAEALSWQAFHDPLTGLPNRALLVERLDAALAQPTDARGITALLFLDLDRFKNVNDTMGHEAGDRLLVEIGERLRAAVRTNDTVARLGGDEFIVLARSLSGRDEATHLADRLRSAISHPISLPQGSVTLTTSVGIAFDIDHSSETLLRDADIALYKAKDHGRDRWEIFDDSLRAETIRRVAAEQLIRRALDDEGLHVHYQPIVDLTTGRVIGAEALLRIMGPHQELLTPSSFISIAEDTGLIVPIGAGVLDDACEQLTRWREELGAEAPATVSVNLSARQLSTELFADLVVRTLDRHGLEPTNLTLELTESILIEAGRAAVDSVSRLHDLGVSLAIDDFGTGYSSLAYLKRFPVDIVKVDRSFIDGLDEQANDTEIVKAILALGEALGLVTVAEGVETQPQLDALRALGCDCAQGYLLARPVASRDLPEAIDRIHRSVALFS